MSGLPWRSARRAAVLIAALVGGCVAAPGSEKPAAAEPPKAHDSAPPGGSIQVVLERQAPEQDLVRTVEGRVVANDADLEAALREARTRHAIGDRPPCVTIDTHGDVPWHDVMSVIESCRRLGIKDVEYGFDTAPSDVR